MLAIRLDADLEARLTAIAKRTGRTKTFYARQAIIDKIDELEDIALLEEALRDPDFGTRRYSLEEVKHELGLDR